jgi:hypothetical protein
MPAYTTTNRQRLMSYLADQLGEGWFFYDEDTLALNSPSPEGALEGWLMASVQMDPDSLLLTVMAYDVATGSPLWHTTHYEAPLDLALASARSAARGDL